VSGERNAAEICAKTKMCGDAGKGGGKGVYGHLSGTIPTVIYRQQHIARTMSLAQVLHHLHTHTHYAGYIYMYLYVYMYITYMYICICIYMYIYVYFICAYMYIYVCVCVCIYIYIIYIYNIYIGSASLQISEPQAR
jgi:hypothetical protein